MCLPVERGHFHQKEFMNGGGGCVWSVPMFRETFSKLRTANITLYILLTGIVIVVCNPDVMIPSLVYLFLTISSVVFIVVADQYKISGYLYIFSICYNQN